MAKKTPTPAPATQTVEAQCLKEALDIDLGLVKDQLELARTITGLVQGQYCSDEAKHALMEHTINDLLIKGLPGRATEKELLQLSFLLRRPTELRLTVRQLGAVEHGKHLAEILIGLVERKVLSYKEIHEADTLALFRRFLATDEGFSDNNIRTHIANIPLQKENKEKE